MENDRITSIVLVAGDRADNYDFGEINPAPPAPLAWTAAAVCVNDAPTVQYQATGATGGTVALFWITEGGRLAERSENLPASGSWLWPGVTVNSAGEPVSWPGWILDDGELVEVPDDRIPTITLRLNGNANTGIVLDYPVCPSQPGRVVQAVPTTPQWILWLLASLLTGVTGVWMRKRPLLT